MNDQIKAFEINSLDAFHLGNLLVGYGESWQRFFKVWTEIKRGDLELCLGSELVVIDYTISMVKVSCKGCWKWINITNTEDYIKEHLLSLLVPDLDEYLESLEAKPAMGDMVLSPESK